jgi:hypothetical protein
MHMCIVFNQFRTICFVEYPSFKNEEEKKNSSCSCHFFSLFPYVLQLAPFFCRMPWTVACPFAHDGVDVKALYSNF